MLLEHVTVLIVEGDVPTADALRAALEQEGAAVFGPATDIDAALIALEKLKPDCAIVSAALAYETAMRLPKRLNAIGVPYLIWSDEPGDGASVEGRNAHPGRTVDRAQLSEAVRTMIAG